MKFLVFLFAACAAAELTTGQEYDAKIVAQEQDIDAEGNYKYAFKTDNGISAEAVGALKNAQSEAASQVVQGAAEWTAPGGEVIKFDYIADENGYQPQGNFIPTPPPIPKAIVQALEYLRAHPPPPSEKN